MKRIALIAWTLGIWVVLGFPCLGQPVQRVVKKPSVPSANPSQKSTSDQQAADSQTAKAITALVEKMQKEQAQERQSEASAEQDNQNIQRKLVKYTGGLVAVGFITAIFIGWQALETRRAAQAAANSVGEIRRQADIMESQKGVLEQSVRAAQDNAIAAKEGAEATNKNVEMFISKERARVRITLKPLNLTTPQFGVYVVEFNVTNCGPSTAFIANSGCVAYYGPGQYVETDKEMGAAIIFPIHSMPGEMVPNSPPVEAFTILFSVGDNTVLTEIKEGRFSVGLRGSIKYRDVFERDRETAFRCIWRLSPIRDVIGEPFSGEWIKCGSAEENKET